MEIIAIILAVAALVLLLLLVNNRKRSQEDQRIQKNYASIIDQANDAMLVIDIVDGKIHQSNPSAAALLGYTSEQLSKKSLFELHPREYLHQSSAIVADVWEKGGLIYKDIPFVTADGTLLPVECSAKVAPFSGRPAIVIYARDIRERLRLEKEINDQKSIIEEKNKDITDSIEYAKKIQEAILPDEAQLLNYFEDSFIFFRPKDIVSGDFYWFTKKGDTVLLAVADCTGHGVPGAFMSMVGNQIIHEMVMERNVIVPGLILDGMKESLLKVFRKREDGGQRQDGMDIAIISYKAGSDKLHFAGAFNGLIITNGSELREFSGDKFPIGYYESASEKRFTTQEVSVSKGDCVYLMSDGYSDQFGGVSSKKFKSKNTAQLIKSIAILPMAEQKAAIENAHVEWKGSLEQVDDICMIGVKL